MKIYLNEADSIVIIKDAPLPPSVNAYLNPIRGRMVKDASVRNYENEFKRSYLACNESSHVDLSETIKEIVCPTEASLCAVEIVFRFERSRLFCKTTDKKSGRKSGDVKALDLDNRLKVVFDSLKKATGFDDSHFFEIKVSKIPVNTLQEQGCNISLIPMKLNEVYDS